MSEQEPIYMTRAEYNRQKAQEQNYIPPYNVTGQENVEKPFVPPADDPASPTRTVYNTKGEVQEVRANPAYQGRSSGQRFFDGFKDAVNYGSTGWISRKLVANSADLSPDFAFDGGYDRKSFIADTIRIAKLEGGPVPTEAQVEAEWRRVTQSRREEFKQGLIETQRQNRVEGQQLEKADPSSGWNIVPWFGGQMLGSAGPETFIAPEIKVFQALGKFAPTVGKMAGAAAVSAGADAFYQGLDVADGVADKYSPGQTIFAGLTGAGFQGTLEGLAGAGGKFAKMFRSEMAPSIVGEVDPTTGRVNAGSVVRLPEDIELHPGPNGDAIVYKVGSSSTGKVTDGQTRVLPKDYFDGEGAWAVPIISELNAQDADFRVTFNADLDPVIVQMDRGAIDPFLPPELKDSAGDFHRVYDKTGESYLVNTKRTSDVREPDTNAAPTTVADEIVGETIVVTAQKAEKKGKKAKQEQAGSLSPAEEVSLDAPVLPAAPEPVISPEARLVQAIKEALPVRAEQDEVYTKIRGERIAAAESVAAKLRGVDRANALSAGMAGKMDKIAFESIASKFTQKESDSLFDIIGDSTLDSFKKLSADSGLHKLLNTEGGILPAPKELEQLSKVFGPEFVKELMVKRTSKDKNIQLLTEGLNLPRSALATLDLSGPLRQGITTSSRKEFYSSLPAMFKAFREGFSGGAKYAEGYNGPRTGNTITDEILKRPSYPDMEESGLFIARDDVTGFNAKEEDFLNNWVEKIPGGIGKLSKGSNEAYKGFLNQLRADLYDNLMSKYTRNGEEVSADFKKGLARYINTTTGRGDLTSVSKTLNAVTKGRIDDVDNITPLLNAGFFSPRLMKSRFDILFNAKYYAQLPHKVRVEQARDLLATGGLITTILSMAKMQGLDVETDPRSSDFATIRDGRTRYDITGGFKQYVTLAARLASGQTKTSEGNVKTLDRTDQRFTENEGDVAARFLRSKLAPVPAYLLNMYQGSNIVGEKFNPSTDAVKMMIPLFVQSLADAYEEEGLTGAAKASPGLFGVGVSTYDNSKPKPEELATQPKQGVEDVLNEEVQPLQMSRAEYARLKQQELKANPSLVNLDGASGGPSVAASLVNDIFPDVVITSTTRGEDHPLSKANPNSDHLLTKNTIDVRPIAGMSLEEFVEELEANGVSVLDFNDETGGKGPKWKTGSHWHLQVDTGE
jgi:hypothetical protein